jgi:hypothetical protein
MRENKGASNTTPVFPSILKIRTPYVWSTCTSGKIGYLYYLLFIKPNFVGIFTWPPFDLIQVHRVSIQVVLTT